MDEWRKKYPDAFQSSTILVQDCVLMPGLKSDAVKELDMPKEKKTKSSKNTKQVNRTAPQKRRNLY